MQNEDDECPFTDNTPIPEPQPTGVKCPECGAINCTPSYDSELYGGDDDWLWDCPECNCQFDPKRI